MKYLDDSPSLMRFSHSDMHKGNSIVCPYLSFFAYVSGWDDIDKVRKTSALSWQMTMTCLEIIVVYAHSIDMLDNN
jgi:hypothetical protein